VRRRWHLLIVWVVFLAACTTSANAPRPTLTATPHPPPTTTPEPFLTRDGVHLLLNGKPYRFTGLNIYNANNTNTCWYTLGTGTALNESIAAIGPGQTIFRARFFQRQATTDGRRDWSAFDHTLALARAHGEKVIATLANQWGTCEEDPAIYKSEAWYRSGYRTQLDPGVINTYRDWVIEIVSRYRDDPTIGFWQLMNEAEDRTSRGRCSSTAAATLQAFAADMAGLVKGIDRHHLLSLGTTGSGQCGTAGLHYRELHGIAGIDLCEYHDYGSPAVAMPGDGANGLKARIADCRSLNKPLFVGETGIRTSRAGSLGARAESWGLKFSAQFEAGVVGELIWTWRDSAHGGSSLTGYEVGPNDPALELLGKY
jgi:mannan endo-1,4-beta-mannosidase